MNLRTPDHTNRLGSDSRIPHRGTFRGGSLLIEVLVSAGLLATLLVIVNQSLVQLHRHTRLGDRQLYAQQLLENALEELLILPWSELGDAAISNIKLAQDVATRLPAAELSGRITEQAEPLPSKRLMLKLRWQDSPGVWRRPFVLTTWVFRQPEATP